MDWNEYQTGSQWAIKAIKRNTPKDEILQEMESIIEAKAIVGIGSDWAEGAYDVLIGRGIVSELGSISAAALVGCNRDAINKAIKAGNLKAKKVDKTYVINPLDLKLWDESANRKRRKKP